MPHPLTPCIVAIALGGCSFHVIVDNSAETAGANAPRISAIMGDSVSQPGRLGAGVIIDGLRLDRVTNVVLATGGTEQALEITSIGETRIVARFTAAAAALVEQLVAAPADAAFEVRSSDGSDRVRVQFAGGAKGSTGAQGQTGIAGQSPPLCNTPGFIAQSNGVGWSCAPDQQGAGGSAITSVAATPNGGLTVTNGTTDPSVALQTCPATQVLHRTGGAWVCAADNRMPTYPMLMGGTTAAHILSVVAPAGTGALNAETTSIAGGSGVVTAANTNTTPSGTIGALLVARSGAGTDPSFAQLEIVETPADLARINFTGIGTSDRWDLAGRTYNTTTRSLNFYYFDGISGSDKLNFIANGPTGAVKVQTLALNGQPFTAGRSLGFSFTGDTNTSCDDVCGQHGYTCAFAVGLGGAGVCTAKPAGGIFICFCDE